MSWVRALDWLSAFFQEHDEDHVHIYLACPRNGMPRAIIHNYPIQCMNRFRVPVAYMNLNGRPVPHTIMLPPDSVDLRMARTMLLWRKHHSRERRRGPPMQFSLHNFQAMIKYRLTAKALGESQAARIARARLSDYLWRLDRRRRRMEERLASVQRIEPSYLEEWTKILIRHEYLDSWNVVLDMRTRRRNRRRLNRDLRRFYMRIHGQRLLALLPAAAAIGIGKLAFEMCSRTGHSR
ncbi:hypothetical protein BT63DRAFT_459476 [Microthyrium microscopicum]|uniref:Uncharacterized protein n=1 Tax=Microthyrium microscopicum TaxID=703497 RepID=A0A6A6TYS6_9PEZI|nr:hypothetical protein BT63DRAFT_459476 [Microthyrium microscopicum]